MIAYKMIQKAQRGARKGREGYRDFSDGGGTHVFRWGTLNAHMNVLIMEWLSHPLHLGDLVSFAAREGEKTCEG